ncbi:MAG: type II toxin-antitoxin system Phd/YefM family antitoxin [Candidatus Promineifilaceae bacterium]
MAEPISVNEAKNKLSAMLKWAVENQDEIVVESHGRPRAVILPYAEYKLFRRRREKEHRQEALERLQELAAANQARNQDLTPKEAEELAADITRETIEPMEAEEKVLFAQS